MTSDTATSATETLAELRERVDRAHERVRTLEREQYEAAAAARNASDQLAHFERTGGRAAERAKLETTLVQARSKAAEPWSERIRGAQAAVRDAQAAVARQVRDRFDELREEIEAEGVIVAEAFADAVRRMVELHAEREAVAQRLSALCSTITRLHPGDVSCSRASQVVIEAQRFLSGGVEEPPRLRRDPREPRRGTGLPAKL